MRRSYRCLALSFVALLAAAPGPGQPPAVGVKLVDYQQLGELVTQNRGKVVVVDFWSTTCIPCIREFPHLVELQKKYGKDGFVAISVSLDDPKNPATLPKVQGLLEKLGATFTNVILDAPPEVWQKRLGSETVPLVYVFNRARKIYKKYGDGVDYADVEKDVQKLLQEK